MLTRDRDQLDPTISKKGDALSRIHRAGQIGVDAGWTVVGGVVHHQSHLLAREQAFEGWKEAEFEPAGEFLAVEIRMVVAVGHAGLRENELAGRKCFRQIVRHVHPPRAGVLHESEARHGVDDEDALPAPIALHVASSDRVFETPEFRCVVVSVDVRFAHEHEHALTLLLLLCRASELVDELTGSSEFEFG